MTKHEHPSQQERDAARRYLEHDYAAMHLSGHARREANRHARDIDENHPRARDIALTGTDRELGPLPRHLREHQRESRQRAGIRPDDAQAIRRQYRSGPPREREETGEEETRPYRERAREYGQRGGELARSAIGSAASTTLGEDVLSFLLAGAGLSIGYLLITRAAAGAKLAEGAANVVRALVSPVIDPLNPNGHPAPGRKTSTATSSGSGRTVGSFVGSRIVPPTTRRPAGFTG